MKNDVAVVIVTFNKKEDIHRLLESLFEMDSAYLLRRLIVVDNASDDGTIEFLENSYGDRIDILAQVENTGGTGGFNAGMSFALHNTKCPYIWLLDNDVIVAKDAVDHLVEFLSSTPDAGAVGSAMLKMESPDTIQEVGGEVAWAGGHLVHYDHNRRIENVDGELREVGFCAAASMLVKREVLETVGFWRDFFIHFDDIEWCHRVRHNGWKIYAHPRSLVWHRTSETKPVTWIRYYDTRNFLYLYDFADKAGRSGKLRRFRLHSAYLKCMGLENKARQIELGIRDYRRGILGKKNNIPTHPFKDASELGSMLRKRERYHFVAPNTAELEALIHLLPYGFAKERKALLYEAVDEAEVSDLQERYGISIVSRSGRISGWFLLSFWHLFLRTLKREYTVLHCDFIERKCFPHKNRRCFVYPHAAGFIDE